MRTFTRAMREDVKDRFALPSSRAAGMLRRLARDRAGNTMAIIAAAIAPLLAMVGGGVDMGRSYLAQSRLQQACDAGVLAARKRLGSAAAVTGEIPDDAAEVGQRFFNVNFRAGSYGTEQRDFIMVLEEDYAVSGEAAVVVPTTLMRIFGYNQVEVRVACEAQINTSNTDVMMVLDVTGSMGETNPGDTVTRLEALKATVKSFHAQLAASTAPGTRIRYGFVPYATNVNVGHLLHDDWVANEWTYQSRVTNILPSVVSMYTYTANWQTVSGSAVTTVFETYPATYTPPTETTRGGYSCSRAPAGDVSQTRVLLSQRTELLGDNSGEGSSDYDGPAGVRTIKHYRRTTVGTGYSVSVSNGTCTVRKTTYTGYVQEYDEITEPRFEARVQYTYKPITMDVSDWRTSSNGCIEERATYVINDYSNVDLDRALDLNLDAIPDRNDVSTQWRPMFPSIIYARSMNWNGTGTFTKHPVTTPNSFIAPAAAGFATCPPQARKLGTMTAEELEAYLGTISAAGTTYHDIGMIWGGRLLSPTGLFASENADLGGSATSRHLIFLTDGQTEPLDLSYSSYGVEPIDARRWDLSSSDSLAAIIEKRFGVACSEVRKRNITVWVIGFGTTLNPVMTTCAGEGHYFVAEDAEELNATFATIAKSLSDLRVTR